MAKMNAEVALDAQRSPVRDIKFDSNGMIKVFKPTPEKVMAIGRHLMENKYSMSDEYRDYPIIYGILDKYLSSKNSLFYEIGDMDGVFGFTDIISGWKSHMIFELLNSRVWGKRLVRESRKLIDAVMDAMELIKISSQTADKRIAKMSRMIGFEMEGARKAEFSWDKKLYDIYLIGRIRPREV